MNVTQIIHKLSTARMEFQNSNGSVLNTFVVPYFIGNLDLRKISHTVALVGSRGSGKSTYIQYFSHATRFDPSLKFVANDELDCILLYWKPDTAYCQGLKQGWLGTESLRFFSLHASLALLHELVKLIRNVNHHFTDLLPSLDSSKHFWKCVTTVTKQDVDSLEKLETWIQDYEYLISTRLNPLNVEGLLSIEPMHMMVYLIQALRNDYRKFESTSFKVFIDEFELLNLEQQALINTYRKQSNQSLNWNVAYKLNAKPSIQTTSDQWLQSPDDYVESNLDAYIKDDFDTFAAEIFISTLQTAGLLCHINELQVEYLGDRKNIANRKTKPYKDKVKSLISSLLPSPTISELSKYTLSLNSVKNKLKEVLKVIEFSSTTTKILIEDASYASLAITIIGTYKQKSFKPKMIEKFILNQLNDQERKRILEKIASYEFNTLLSLNLQNSSIQIPVYAGFDRFITMTTPNIRHFKELCLATLKQCEAIDSGIDYQYVEELKTIPLDAMHLGAISKSSSLVKEVISYPPYGNRLSLLVNRIGDLFRMSQKSSYQTEPERVIFTFPYDHAGADVELEAILDSAVSWRVLVCDDSKRIKDQMQITSKEYQLNPIYAPKFGISFRKKRGVNLSLKDFKLILTGTPTEFEDIRKSYQLRWKASHFEEVQGELEL